MYHITITHLLLLLLLGRGRAVAALNRRMYAERQLYNEVMSAE